MAKLSKIALNKIDLAIEKLFTRAKSRFMGGIPPGAGKGIIISFSKTFSLPQLFASAARHQGTRHSEDLLESVQKIGLSYLDALKEKTKAKAINSIQSYLNDSDKPDFDTVLEGELSDLWGSVTSEVKKIVETETHIGMNLSTADAISKINASNGISDPLVAFLCVHDTSLCEECKRLHLLKDGKTPRVWKMSELGSGYHTKGDSNPKIGGLHPHDRCIMVSIMPGYGFDSSGHIEFKSSGWNELENQRK